MKAITHIPLEIHICSQEMSFGALIKKAIPQNTCYAKA